MNPTLRRILFFVFVASFLIGAPLLIFYTAGFRYNWQSGTLFRTGVLSVSTTPRNVDILLEGKSIDRQTPAVIKQLMPGTYDLVLSRDGYHSWNNTVAIQSNITTHLPLVYLWRNESPTIIWSHQADNLIPNPKGTLVAYLSQQGGWNELWLKDLSTDEEKMIARVAGANTQLSVAWNTNGDNLLLQNQTLKTLAVYDQDGLSLETTATTIAEQLALTNLLISANDSLMLVDTATQTELQRITDEEVKIIALLPKNQYTVARRDGDLLLFVNPQNELLLINIKANEPILFKQRVAFYDYLATEQLLLWSDGHEINIYNPNNHQTEFITRQAEPITQLRWLTDGSKIMIASGNKLIGVDRYKNGEQRYSAILASADELKNFWTSSNSETSFLDATINGQSGVYSLRLR